MTNYEKYREQIEAAKTCIEMRHLVEKYEKIEWKKEPPRCDERIVRMMAWAAAEYEGDGE